METVYRTIDQVTLGYVRILSTGNVSGLSVSVVVKNAITQSVLLASTACPEVGTTGVYVYNWTHGLTVTTKCIAVYTVGSNVYEEFFIIDDTVDKHVDNLSGRGI